MGELKPCPFCGSKANIISAFDNKVYYASCTNHKCRATVKAKYGRGKLNIDMIDTHTFAYSKGEKPHTITAEEARTLCVATWNERT